MDARLDDLDSERLRQLGQGLDECAVQLRDRASVPRDLDPKRSGHGVPSVRPNTTKPLLAMLDQALGVARAEGTAAAQQEDGLQQGRLAGRISTPDEVVPGMELQLGPLEAAKVLDAELGEAHPSERPIALEPHRHDDVLGLRRARRADQAAAVRVRQPDLDLVGVDRRQRIQQVVDVEADLELLALVARLRSDLRLLPARGYGPGS